RRGEARNRAHLLFPEQDGSQIRVVAGRGQRWLCAKRAIVRAGALVPEGVEIAVQIAEVDDAALVDGRGGLRDEVGDLEVPHHLEGLARGGVRLIEEGGEDARAVGGLVVAEVDGARLRQARG